jgi:hypothetical protein
LIEKNKAILLNEQKNFYAANDELMRLKGEQKDQTSLLE